MTFSLEIPLNFQTTAVRVFKTYRWWYCLISNRYPDLITSMNHAILKDS